MTEQQQTLQQQIIAKSLKDERFRQQLLTHPTETLEQEFGITFPQGVSVQVHENTATTLHVVLPAKAQAGELVELSDAELEEVGGGYNSNGCGPAYSFRGQLTCDPSTSNLPPPKGL